MDENEKSNSGGNGVGDSGDSGGSSGSADGGALPFAVVGDGDGDGDGGSSSGNSGGSRGGNDGQSRRERSARNKRDHSKKTQASRPTEVKVTERRKSATAKKPAPIPPEPLGDLVAVCFAITAQRKGEHWNLAKEEKNAWGEALANVLVHVPMPEKQVGIVADIIAVGFVAYATVAPRIAADNAALNAAQNRATVPPVAGVPDFAMRVGEGA